MTISNADEYDQSEIQEMHKMEDFMSECILQVEAAVIPSNRKFLDSTRILNGLPL